jgi:ABC-type transport system involved in multi-copper enzyme maturation permease subunit
MLSLLLVLLALPFVAFAQTTDDGGILGGLLASTTSIICCIAYWVIGIAIVVWVYRDASSRGESAILWVIIVLLLNWIGLVLYLLLGRRKPQQMPPA